MDPDTSGYFRLLMEQSWPKQMLMQVKFLDFSKLKVKIMVLFSTGWINGMDLATHSGRVITVAEDGFVKVIITDHKNLNGN